MKISCIQNLVYFFSDRKKYILAKISLTVKYKEKASLEDLSAPKKHQKPFKFNPYQAGKDLLDPKLNVSFFVAQVAQVVLYKHSSGSVKDNNHGVSLEATDRLPPKPGIKISFIFDDFARVLFPWGNKSTPGIDAILYKSL